MKIKDRHTGFIPDEEFGLADDMDEDRACPECGAGMGQQCLIQDPDDPEMGIELGKFVHLSRTNHEKP